MSLKLGSTSIGSLYLGSTKIVEAYLGNVKVYNSDSPYTLFFEMTGSDTISTNIASTIDLRTAGMPSTSDLPVVAFKATADCVTSSMGNPGNILFATTAEDIVGLGIDRNNSYSLDYGGTKQTIVASMATGTKITNMKWIFEYSTTSNQWNYTTYYAQRRTGFTAVGSPISIGTNTPFDINRWYSTGTSTNSRIVLSHLIAVGFKNISDAISWNGSWPIT